ncbi:MAG: hypothetical protein Q7S33_01340 [Nanoarchaeota archaeon]|nr:hypothetical protein [Nanoarchaeota archaeon]
MPKEVKKKGRAKRIILSIAIAILFVMFIAYAIETIYPSPKYEDYCKIDIKQYYIQTNCEDNGGRWNEYGLASPGQATPIKDGLNQTGYCDMYYTCSKEYQDTQEKYNRNVFFASIILGILTIIIAVIINLESVSTGFMAGGVILIIYGTIRYWGNLSDVLRTIMLGITLGVLVWIGYKKLKE